MHAIGQLIMHTAMPGTCKELDQTMDMWNEGRIAYEQSMLGYHYANVSAELSRRWGFPPVFSEVIDSFPEVTNTSEPNPIAAIIHLATWFSRAQKNALTIEQMQSEFPTKVGQLLGLSFENINEEMPSLDELCDGLDVLIV